MSEEVINATVEPEDETVASSEAIVDNPVAQVESDNAENGAPIYEQAAGQVAEPEKKLSVKDILLFAQNNIFTAKVCNIILFSLKAIITILCILQIVFWGLSIKNTYLNYWEAIKTFDVVNISVIVLMLLFIIVLVSNIVKSISSLINRDRETRFETVSTLFAFYVFSMFITRLFYEHDLLISDFTFNPILRVLVILTLVYAFVRLFVKDFGSRICPLIFSCGAIVLAIIMFSQGVGNFATYTINDSVKFDLSDLNIYKYLESVVNYKTNAELTGGFDGLFFAYGKTVSFNEIGTDGIMIIVTFLQFVSIAVANVLPYVALSLLGWLVYGLVGKNYMQYYNLQACKKVATSMLVVSIFSLATTICLHFLCEATEHCRLVVQVNYANVIVTMLFCIVLIIVTSLPWKIYNVIYRHRYTMYRKTEGDK